MKMVALYIEFAESRWHWRERVCQWLMRPTYARAVYAMPPVEAREGGTDG